MFTSLLNKGLTYHRPLPFLHPLPVVHQYFVLSHRMLSRFLTVKGYTEDTKGDDK